MNEGFITWSMLYDWVSFVAIVFMVVQFVKNVGFLKNIDNKYIAFITSIILLVISNLVGGTFDFKDIILYLLTSILVTTQSAGIYDAGKEKLETKTPSNAEEKIN